MKKHLSFAITVLTAAMLACESVVDYFQQAGDESYSKVEIKNLAVNPPAGNGSGSIELAVTYEWHNDHDPFTGKGMYSESIECNFVSPNFITKHIGTIPPSPSPENGTVTQTAKLSFVIDQPAQPGTYVVGCNPLTGTKQVTTPFVVTEEKAPTEPPVAPPQEPPKPTPTFTPITVKGTGRQIYVNGNSNNVNCTIPAELSLTVESDGRAELSIITRAMDRVYSTDFSECFWQPENVTVTVSCNSDRGSETVTINRDQYPLCDGTFSYAGGVLSGEFLCLDSATSTVGTKYVIP